MRAASSMGSSMASSAHCQIRQQSSSPAACTDEIAVHSGGSTLVSGAALSLDICSPLAALPGCVIDGLIDGIPSAHNGYCLGISRAAHTAAWVNRGVNISQAACRLVHEMRGCTAHAASWYMTGLRGSVCWHCPQLQLLNTSCTGHTGAADPLKAALFKNAAPPSPAAWASQQAFGGQRLRQRYLECL